MYFEVHLSFFYIPCPFIKSNSFTLKFLDSICIIYTVIGKKDRITHTNEAKTEYNDRKIFENLINDLLSNHANIFKSDMV